VQKMDPVSVPTENPVSRYRLTSLYPFEKYTLGEAL